MSLPASLLLLAAATSAPGASGAATTSGQEISPAPGQAARPASLPAGDHPSGFDSITDERAREHVLYLASPELGGRDTPSAGLDHAEAYVAEALASYGYEGLGPEGSFLRPWTYPRELEAPVEDGCSLVVERAEATESGAQREPVLRRDFVPFPGANGQAEGELVFLGFGIHAPKDKYDDLRGKGLEGKLALVLTEEPRHPKKLEGPEVSAAADAYDKLDELAAAGLAGVLFVRRPGAVNAVDERGRPLDEGPEVDLDVFGFHHTWPLWNDPRQDRGRRAALPAIEVTPALASELLGEDVLALAATMDRTGKPLRRDPEGVVVRFEAKTELRRMSADNVVGVLPGSDPDLAAEYVVLGAHLDHLGTDSRGRVAAGADDNGSGIAALLEVAEALALAGPRRSILVCAFSGEEDGLLGSGALVEDPPVATGSMVAMLNMDMIGRGKDSEAIVLGVGNNPDLGRTLKDALRLEKTGIKKTVTNKGDELWRRSDHYSFHRVGVPVLFFFEALPISDNEDYHTWRDVPADVDFGKVGNTARLVYNTAWLLAQDDDRPDEPRR